MRMKPERLPEFVSDKSGIAHSPTGRGDQAFDNVVNALKKDPNAFDTSGMGGRTNISDRD